MPGSRKLGEGQQAMMITHGAEQLVSSQALPVVPESAVTDRIEQAVHLTALLGRFDVMPGKEDWLNAAQRPNSALHRNLFSGSQEKAHDIIGGRQKEYDELKTDALELFGRAFGEYVIVDAQLAAPDEAADMKLAEYRVFEAHYRGSSTTRKERRQLYRDHLANVITTRVAAIEMPVDLTARVSLARMLRPEFQGLKAANYADISFAEAARFKPAILRHHLINVGSQTPNAIGHLTDDNPPRLTFVVQSPDALKISRSVTKLAETAVNASEKKRREAGVDLDAPRRAGMHALEGRKAGIKKYQINVVDKSLALIGQFEEALGNNAGLARFGSEAKARQKLVELQTGTFDELLWAAALGMGVPQEERLAMRRSIEKAMYFAPTAAARRRNFGMMLGLAKDWRNAQNNLFTTLVLTCDNYLEKHKTDADELS